MGVNTADLVRARHDHPVRIPEGKFKKRERQIYEDVKAAGGEKTYGAMKARIDHAERRIVHWREELEKIKPGYPEELLDATIPEETDILVIEEL